SYFLSLNRSFAVLGDGASFVALGDGVLVDGDRHRERRSGAWLAPQPDASVVVGSDVLDDRQAQTRSAGGARPRGVAPEEPLENRLLMLAGDADTAVGDGDFDVSAATAPADRNR